MPSLTMTDWSGFGVNLSSNCDTTIIAWFDEWLPRFADPEYPVQIWVTSPVWADTKDLKHPDWSCDTRFMGTPLNILAMQGDGKIISGETAYRYLMAHKYYIKRLEEADNERRGIKRFDGAPGYFKGNAAENG